MNFYDKKFKKIVSVVVLGNYRCNVGDIRITVYHVKRTKMEERVGLCVKETRIAKEGIGGKKTRKTANMP